MEDALNAALRLLSYRPRSEEEIRRRLVRRFLSEDVESVMDHLRDLGLVNDRAFALAWRQGRESSRPRSEYMLRYELVKMGVPRAVAEEALQGYDDEKNAYNAARKFAPRLMRLDYGNFNRKLTGYLNRRGFGRAAIREAVEGTWNSLTHSVDGTVEC